MIREQREKVEVIIFSYRKGGVGFSMRFPKTVRLRRQVADAIVLLDGAKAEMQAWLNKG